MAEIREFELDQIKVRRLNTLDLVRVAKLIKKVMDEVKGDMKAAREQVTAKVTAEEGTNEHKQQTAELERQQAAARQELGLAIFQQAFDAAENEVIDLLASVAKMTREEFLNAPIETPLEVVEQLSNAEDLVNFIKRAQGLVKKLSRNKSTVSKADTDGQTKPSLV